MKQTKSIVVKGTAINVLLDMNQNDYICLTDMTKGFFKTPEFWGIRMEAGSNRFYMSVNKFIERTNAK